MNVNELNQLATWFRERYPSLSKLYAALHQPIQHNANQANKQPVQEPLDSLVDYLDGMSFDTLSLEQLHLLEARDVAQYIGPEGARRVEAIIKRSDYDPATAAAELQKASAAINTVHSQLEAYSVALKGLGIDLQEFEDSDDFITIRVGFRQDASIKNVVDLRKSAADWYEIIRGVSLAAGEAPENTRVVGAGTGSILLFLASTAAVTFLLARISKHLTGIAHDIISAEAARERLKQDKLLTKAISNDLDKQIKEMKDGAIEHVVAEVRKENPKIGGDTVVALTKSVSKLLAFNRKGGDLDFVAPSEDLEEESEDGATSAPPAQLKARKAIEEFHEMRDRVRLLSHQSVNDNPDEE